MSNGYMLISDVYKDAYGFRPSIEWLERFDAASEEDRDDTFKRLCLDIEASIKVNEAHHASALKEFEDYLNGMMNDYGITLSDALLWDMDAFDVNLDDSPDEDHEIEAYLFAHHIAFDDMPKFKKAIKKGLRAE